MNIKQSNSQKKRFAWDRKMAGRKKLLKGREQHVIEEYLLRDVKRETLNELYFRLGISRGILSRTLKLYGVKPFGKQATSWRSRILKYRKPTPREMKFNKTRASAKMKRRRKRIITFLLTFARTSVIVNLLNVSKQYVAELKEKWEDQNHGKRLKKRYWRRESVEAERREAKRAKRAATRSRDARVRQRKSKGSV